MDCQTYMPSDEMRQKTAKKLADLEESLKKKMKQIEDQIQNKQQSFLQQLEQLMDLTVKKQEYEQEIAQVQSKLRQLQDKEFNHKKSNFEELEALLINLQQNQELEIQFHNIFLQDFEQFDRQINQTISSTKTKLDQLQTSFKTKMQAEKQKIQTQIKNCESIKNSFDLRLEKFRKGFKFITSALNLKQEISAKPTNWHWENESYVRGKSSVSQDGLTVECLAQQNQVYHFIFGNRVFGDQEHQKWRIKYTFTSSRWVFVGVCEEKDKQLIINQGNNKAHVGTYKNCQGIFLAGKNSHNRLDNHLNIDVLNGDSVDLEMNMPTGEFKVTYNGHVVGTKNLKGKKIVPFINVYYKGEKFETSFL